MRLPLEGYTILEMGSALAGPYCGRILGDFGARVIKVEMPGTGDPARGWGPRVYNGSSAVFHAVNKEKDSLVIDFNDTDDMTRLKNLIASGIDAVVQNLRPGVADDAGVGAEDCCALNPAIIYCNVSAFGAKGPLSDAAGYEPLLQAFSGIIEVTGDPDGPPARVGFSVNDIGCPSHLFHLSQKPWNFGSPPDTLSSMHKIIEIFADRAALHTEILALRQQVAVLKRKRPRPSLRKADRVFWVILSCLWPGWRHALVIVRPETVIGWHRKGFRLFWTWKSRRGKPGRPPVSREIRYLVRRMSRENTRWGAPRIHGELLKLGFSISQAAVSKYMVRYPSPPSQSWRTFLTNHANCLASIDFFVVPTATFHLLFGFIVLHHERRQIVHFGVTANPTMAWVAQQIREAFPWGTAPRYLIRDRDGAYGQSFRSTVTAMGVEEVVTAPRSPWQNPYVERLIGSVRRECLDHSIILNERHLRRILGSYLDYYHGSRTHLSLGKDTPDGRPVQPAGSGTVVSLPKVGGLHHRYERLAA